jgi:hypothetical protein
MTAQDVLIRQLERQLEGFLRAVKAVPTDKLEWVAAEGLRSALDQFQEVATAVSEFWTLYTDHKFAMSPEIAGVWMVKRRKITSIDELESRLRADTAQLIELVRNGSAESLNSTVDVPMPGETKLVDAVSFHYWNMSYHEGQINLIVQMLANH